MPGGQCIELVPVSRFPWVCTSLYVPYMVSLGDFVSMALWLLSDARAAQTSISGVGVSRDPVP